MQEPSIKQNVTKMLKTNAAQDKHIDALSSIYWYVTQKSQKQRICQDIRELLGKENYIIGYNLTAKQTKKLGRNLAQRK